MKTATRSAPVQPMLPASLLPARQMSIAFETAALVGLAADQRAMSTKALAAMLLQAAGVHLPEDDDVEP